VCSGEAGCIEGVEQRPLLIFGVRCQVAIGSVGHRQGRAHPAREREKGDARGQRPRRIGVAKIVDSPVLDPGSDECRAPDSIAPLVQLDVTASRCREEEGRVKGGGTASRASRTR
jgi:hypothetical protein